MTTTPITIADIDWRKECLSLLRSHFGSTIVRPTRDGKQFAVIAISGADKKILKVLPTLERARAYNFAIHR